MINSVLVVCVGNICRSPLGERLLRADLRQRGSSISVSSAGLHALVGEPADAETALVAEKNGVSMDAHQARQFTDELARISDLILVMEPGHKTEIVRKAPALSGKIMLFDQWSGGKGIMDPYKRSREFHEAVFLLVRDASQAWAARLAPAAR